MTSAVSNERKAPILQGALSIYKKFTNLKLEGGTYVGRCPLHSEESGSFKVDERGQNGQPWPFHCFGCKKGGDVFTFLKARLNLPNDEDFPKVLAEAEKLLGNHAPDAADLCPPGTARTKPKKVKKVVPIEEYQASVERLLNNTDALRFLSEQRGITRDTAERLKLGFVQEHRYRIKNEENRAKGWICFPRVYGDKVLAIKFRSIVEKDFSQVYGMNQNTFFNHDAINPFQPIFMTEGEFDSCILEQAGFCAVSPQSAGVEITPEMGDALKQATAIYLAGDNDSTVGTKYMQELSERFVSELAGQEKPVYVIKWPGAKDANEFFLRVCGGEVETFKVEIRKLMENAIPVGDKLRVEVVDEQETPTKLEYPEMGDDLLSQFARMLADGTERPYCHLRENIKIFAGFCLGNRAKFPGHEDLFMRGWHLNMGESETAKTRAFKDVMDWFAPECASREIHIRSLGAFGSKQLLIKEFKKTPRMLIHVTEGRSLATGDENIARVFSTFNQLTDETKLETGSFTNGEHIAEDCQGSSVICITPDDYDRAFSAKGLIRGGTMNRWTLSYSEPNDIDGDWTPRPKEELNSAFEKIQERLAVPEFHIQETGEARAIRFGVQAKLKALVRSGSQEAKRLYEHYKREVTLSAVFSADPSLIGVIGAQQATAAAKWVEHQLQLREKFWTVDSGNAVERMEKLAQKALQKKCPLSERDLKTAANVARPGSGGDEAWNRAFSAMRRGDEATIRKAKAKNRKGFPMYCLVDCAGHGEPQLTASGSRSDSNKANVLSFQPDRVAA
jgi:hypothetical protein